MLEKDRQNSFQHVTISGNLDGERKGTVGTPFERGQETEGFPLAAGREFVGRTEFPALNTEFLRLEESEEEGSIEDVASIVTAPDGDTPRALRYSPEQRPPAGILLSQRTSLSTDRDAELATQATKNVESFVAQLVGEAVDMVVMLVNIALLSGIAASAIAPVIKEGEEGAEWVALHGGEQLAEWASAQIAANTHADQPLDLAKRLGEHIRGRAESGDDLYTVEDAHPKVGEDVVRLLQSLNVSQILEEALAQASQQQRSSVLDLFRRELSKLTRQQPQNAYLYDYTLQEIATQGFFLALDATGQDSKLTGALKELRAEIRALRQRPVGVIEIHTGGGAFVAGNVNVASGDFVGRDIRVTSRC